MPKTWRSVYGRLFRASTIGNVGRHARTNCGDNETNDDEIDTDMKLLAISDLHLDHDRNRAALEQLPAAPDDWLIVAGDIGERFEYFDFALTTLGERFAKLLWVPGNHDLWTTPADESGLRGEARYEHLVELCRSHGVLTPEDPYPVWPGDGHRCSSYVILMSLQ